jgi:predicted kinase
MMKKNREIIITVGISNSGKSTWAKELRNSDKGKYVIINRDKLRELLFGYTESSVYEYYSQEDLRDMEKLISKYEDTLINETLEMGRVPIVDATHLKRDYLERFKYWNIPVELKWFDISLGEAKERNRKRERSVHEKILEVQQTSFEKLKKDLEQNPIDFNPVELVNSPEKPPVVIFDIDGTLAHRGDRGPYDWLSVGKDIVDNSVALLNDYLSTSAISPEIVICTGRDEMSLDETKKWLEANKITYNQIYYRDKGDMRRDWIVKEEMWRHIAKDRYIVGMFEDRLQVVRRARALGLKVFNVEYNNF